MAERAAVTTKSQVGLETTPGTSVAASKFLPSLAFTMGIDGQVTDLDAGGLKFPTSSVLGREWTMSKVSGQPTYDEMVYLLASILQKVTPATVDTSARSWAMSVSSDAEDTIATYTIEKGQTGASLADKSVYNFLTELSLKGDRTKTEVSGTFAGQQFTSGVTLTAAPTQVGNQVPMMPGDVSVFADPTSGALGTTKLTRVLSWELNLRNVRQPLWVVDNAVASWAVPVESKIDLTLKLKMATDTQGMAQLTKLRNSTKTFLRLKSTSTQNAGSTTQKFDMSWDICGVIAETPKELSDADGLYAVDWTFKAVHDTTWAKATQCTLVNKVTAL